MLLKLYLFLIYIWDKINFISINKYYEYKYNENTETVFIKNITLIYYLSFLLIYNEILLDYFKINTNNVIIKKKNNYFLLKNKKFEPIIPKGIIDNIELNIKNHRYELNNLKKNIFCIDKNLPVIFCLGFFENINNISYCFINCKYKIKFNDLKKVNLHKVNKNDIINNLF